MKNINLSALSQLSLAELTDFLKWLDKHPTGQMTLNQLKTSPSIRSNKIGSMLRILESFGFITADSVHVILNDAGRRFSRLNLVEKMALLRGLFLGFEEFKTVLELFQNSQTGRLKARVVYYALKEANENLTETEARALISWAHWSELFHYDKKRDEVIAGRLPIGPNQTSDEARAVS